VAPSLYTAPARQSLQFVSPVLAEDFSAGLAKKILPLTKKNSAAGGNPQKS
jgi:hypothetical protein